MLNIHLHIPWSKLVCTYAEAQIWTVFQTRLRKGVWQLFWPSSFRVKIAICSLLPLLKKNGVMHASLQEFMTMLSKTIRNIGGIPLKKAECNITLIINIWQLIVLTAFILPLVLKSNSILALGYRTQIQH